MTMSLEQSVGAGLLSKNEVTRIEAGDVGEGPGVIDPRSFKHSNKNTTEPDPGM